MKNKKLFLDFETRSECDLKERGAHNYANHPSTEILCAAWAIDDGPVNVWRPDPMSFDAQEQPGFVKALVCGATLIAHNASFELAILERFFLPSAGSACEVIDTAALAASLALPRALSGACVAIGTTQMKSDAGAVLIALMSVVRKATKTDKSRWVWSPELQKQLEAYCMQDVEALRELYGKLAPYVTPEFLRTSAIDREINSLGFRIDATMAEAGARLSKLVRANADDECRAITGGIGVGQVAKLGEWCGLTDMTAEGVDAALKGGNLRPDIRRALELRQTGSKTSLGKYAAALESADADGVIRGALMINGGWTGRWSGRGFQPHNLPRGAIEVSPEIVNSIRSGRLAEVAEYGEPSEVLSSALRSLIIPREPGQLLIACDYASIELRVLLWLAGEVEALEVLRRGDDLYIDMAATIYGIAPGEVDKRQRGIGKSALLGLGYGMGAAKFAERCRAAGQLEAASMAAEIVDVYRSKYRRVVALWSRLEDALREAAGGAADVRCGRLLMSPHNVTREGGVVVQLPSGRSIYYHDVRASADGRLSVITTRGSARVKTEIWGRAVAENVCQSVANCLLRDAMARATEQMPLAEIVLHVHDELVVSALAGNSASVKRQLIEIMRTPPAWAAGLPLAAEAWVAERYKK